MSQAKAFCIDVSSAQLEDLNQRLALSRLPDRAPRPAWDDGVDIDVLGSLLAKWRHSFNWPEQQSRLNALPHYRCEVDGLGLHFLHFLRHRAPTHGPDSAAVPIMLVHGWPSTFVQMTRLAALLVEPESGVGRDVIVPSLPGFAFSDRPEGPGWNLDRMARSLHQLMTVVLGYSHYAVRGSDFGLPIALRLGYLYPDQVVAIHVGGMHLRAETIPDDLEPEEADFIEASRRWYRTESAYNDVQATKPQTLGVALNDSPVGLLAWICEKFRTWSVPDALFDVFTPDDILTTVSIFWFTETMTSSVRLYREELLSPTPLHPVKVPLFVCQPILEEYRAPESWWRRTQSVTRYTELPESAHFPEWEAPRHLVNDISTALSSLTHSPGNTLGQRGPVY